MHLREGGEGLDFLGFHHRWVRARGARHVCFLARWPARQGMQHARDQIRELTDRRWLLRPVDETTRKVNAFLRGWAGYFRYGNSAKQLARIGELVAAGDVCVEIAELIPLGEAARAHELSESRHTRGKIVLALPSYRGGLILAAVLLWLTDLGDTSLGAKYPGGSISAAADPPGRRHRWRGPVHLHSLLRSP